MSEIPLKNQIINWLKNQQYWFQYSGNEILEGNEISEKLVEETYTYFKEDLGLIERNEKTPIDFKEITTTSSEISKKLFLKSIHSLENVNALASGQSIEINPNLTIIYGNNGSGKSGYTRLLNNAFISRGDKHILGNVFLESETGLPKCSFTFEDEDKIFEKVFPDDLSSNEFYKFSCFDTQSVKIHLDNDNQLNFTPNGFDFFDKVLLLFDAIREKLNTEIQNKKVPNNFIIHFQNENSVKNLITSLGTKTDKEELIRLSTFSEEDKIQLEKVSSRIVELRTLNIQVQITGLEKLQRELLSFIHRQQTTLNLLTKEKVDLALELIKNHTELQQLSKEQGVKSLENYDIKLVGKGQWRDFIISAKNYSMAIEKARDNVHYPSDNEHCLFCLQPLNDAQIELIETYWNLLKSEAEREMNRTSQKIKDIVKELRGLIPVKFDDTINLYNYLVAFNPTLVSKWKTIVDNSEKVKNNLIQNLENINIDLPVSSFNYNTNEFQIASIQIQKEIDTLSIKKPDQEIASLTFQMLLLKDRLLLNQLLPKIQDYIENENWIEKAENSISSLRTNSITTLQGNLFSQHITEKYTEVFNEECEKLDAPKIVNISQQSSKAKTFRKLQIKKQVASQILSEGEQRAISLADFLTEIQLNPNNKGVIFDDPVTSLDHTRRAIIAKRLAELSKDRQVIIFSHDLLFVNFLKSYVEYENINFQCHWIEKISEKVGIISNNNSPATEGDYKTTKNALEAWNLSRKSEPQAREKALKDGFASLRTNYEYLVIFDLFQKVVLRFEERVSIERLKEVVIVPEFTNKIIEKVGLLSRYIEAHLHSDTFISTKPTSEDLKKEIDDFQKLKTELSEIRKNANK
jgi:energy-coupling factor transporter ATP-binding protein EcfA2